MHFAARLAVGHGRRDMVDSDDLAQFELFCIINTSYYATILFLLITIHQLGRLAALG